MSEYNETILQSVYDFKQNKTDKLEIIGKQFDTDEKGNPTFKGISALAEAMEIYSDKQYETARYLFVKNGTVIRHVTVSSQIPSSTIIEPDENFLYKIKKYADDTNSQIVLLHNHPSGYVEPSEADKKLTEYINNFLTNKDGSSRFSGHIILDHGNYGLYSPDIRKWNGLINGNLLPLDEIKNHYEIELTDFARRIDFNPEDGSIDSQKLKELSDYAKQCDSGNLWNTKDWIPGFFLSVNGVLTTLEQFNTAEFSNPAVLENKLKEIGRNFGSENIVLFPQNKDQFLICEGFAQKTGTIKDIYFENEDGTYKTSAFRNGKIFHRHLIDDIRIEDTENNKDEVENKILYEQNKLNTINKENNMSEKNLTLKDPKKGKPPLYPRRSSSYLNILMFNRNVLASEIIKDFESKFPTLTDSKHYSALLKYIYRQSLEQFEEGREIIINGPDKYVIEEAQDFTINDFFETFEDTMSDKIKPAVQEFLLNLNSLKIKFDLDLVRPPKFLSGMNDVDREKVAYLILNFSKDFTYRNIRASQKREELLNRIHKKEKRLINEKENKTMDTLTLDNSKNTISELISEKVSQTKSYINEHQFTGQNPQKIETFYKTLYEKEPDLFNSIKDFTLISEEQLNIAGIESLPINFPYVQLTVPEITDDSNEKSFADKKYYLIESLPESMQEQIYERKKIIKEKNIDIKNKKTVNDLSKIIVIDTETTGFKAGDDELLQVSIIDGNGKELYNRYVKPENKKEWKYAMEKNHITPEMVSKSPSIKELIPEIQKIIDDADMLISYNGRFDVNFLEAAGITNIEQKPHLDVIKPASLITKLPPKNKNDKRTYNGYHYPKLTDAAEAINFNYNAHDSLEDVKATLAVAKNIYGENFEKLTEKDLLECTIDEKKVSAKEKKLKTADNQNVSINEQNETISKLLEELNKERKERQQEAEQNRLLMQKLQDQAQVLARLQEKLSVLETKTAAENKPAVNESITQQENGNSYPEQPHQNYVNPDGFGRDTAYTVGVKIPDFGIEDPNNATIKIIKNAKLQEVKKSEIPGQADIILDVVLEDGKHEEITLSEREYNDIINSVQRLETAKATMAPDSPQWIHEHMIYQKNMKLDEFNYRYNTVNEFMHNFRIHCIKDQCHNFGQALDVVGKMFNRMTEPDKKAFLEKIQKWNDNSNDENAFKFQLLRVFNEAHAKCRTSISDIFNLVKNENEQDEMNTVVKNFVTGEIVENTDFKVGDTYKIKNDYTSFDDTIMSVTESWKLLRVQKKFYDSYAIIYNENTKAYMKMSMKDFTEKVKGIDIEKELGKDTEIKISQNKNLQKWIKKENKKIKHKKHFWEHER